MQQQIGRHVLRIPRPSSTPLQILAAIVKPQIDHRGPEFAELGLAVLTGIRTIFKTANPVVIYPTSGTGACEAAPANTLSPSDRVVIIETGWFSALWHRIAAALGIAPKVLEGDWRNGVDAGAIEARLREDRAHAVKAVTVVHHETSTGVASNIAAVRRALDRTGHPVPLQVDTISSLDSIDHHHHGWCVDVRVGGSQKGLMLPPGLSLNASSDEALAASRPSRFPRSFFRWDEILKANPNGYFSHTSLTDGVFRIGHLGEINNPMVTGTLSSVEIGRTACGIPHRVGGGVGAAMAVLAGNAPLAVQAAA